MPQVNGRPYKNTTDCWLELGSSSRDARYMGLIPVEDFIDRRNDAPIIYLSDEANYLDAPNSVGIFAAGCPRRGGPDSCRRQATTMPALPGLYLSRPTTGQRFHVELWCEKTTVNDVLRTRSRVRTAAILFPAQVNYLRLPASTSSSGRAPSGKPVRVLYQRLRSRWQIDARGGREEDRVRDPRSNDLDIDIQVRPIILTHKQCKKYRLPRTPIKETERRAAH